jgi:CheY-like chemotaxis protein
MMGWADLGLHEAPSDSSLRSHFQKIRHQADRAAALTRQLLAFARRQVLQPRNVNLNQTVTNVTSLLENIIGEQIEVKTMLAPELRLTRADPTHIEQVLMNLCLNARDAMPQGGRLLIETCNMRFEQEACRGRLGVRPGDYVLLSISDSGVGMDSVTVERIFEPFFTTKETGKGTGLGLAVVYGIVKQHGGFINVYSELGRGTTFHVYLPAGDAPVPEPEKKISEPVRGGAETILVAEDHEGVRDMAREVLETFGYKVLLASDGEEAVRMVEEHRERIALVILDVVLPKLGGPEAYQRMTAVKPGLAVIFSTGYTAEAAQLRSMLEKGAAVLQKPYMPERLARKVRETLDHTYSSSKG